MDPARLRALGLPFWLAGGFSGPEGLRAALDAGAAGVQVGTAFALCADSGLRADYRRALLEQVIEGRARVFTDPSASPTGSHSRWRSWPADVIETLLSTRPRSG